MREGWEVKRLGEIATVEYGFTAKSTLTGTLRYVRITDIDNEGNLTLNAKKYIEDNEDTKKFKLLENDILMARTGATFGKVLLYKDYEPSVFASYLIRINFTINMDNKLYWYFSHSEFYWNQATSLSSGSAQPHFNGKALKELVFKYPKSLEEQKQIVKTLDLAFKQIDQAKANLEKNLNNAKELFQSKLNEVFSQRVEGWEEKTLKEVCEITSKLIDPKEEKYQDLVHIGAGNIASEKGTLSNLQTAKEENLISGKFLFDEEMVLYSKIRPYLMKVVKCEFIGLCSADIYPLVPIHNEITQSLLYYLLLSNNFTEYAIEGSQRAGMPKVNRKHLFEYSFYLPNIKEQEEEAKVLDKLFEISLNLQTHYQQKLNNIEELKKSILEKAFKGEL
ncbi:MAG: Type I restriction-modification system, specificity subunit S (EC [uncultured Sulfurovum sp.]|uniref:Type I restriction-modification system, specificity subunit S (EC) n=1 Tax=uncultured Sulfurovum sp. TaxID=269237 RepID=A0A6S6TD55_9BACT|nr:MAG: Type I restriction-modification system, specificity subunit S (EC [uncultured Sulfurovum sp.]